MKFLVVLVTYITLASAINFEEPKEERTFSNLYNTNDGYLYLGLNATYLWGAVILAGIAVAGILVAASGAIPLAAENIQRKAKAFSEEIFVDTEGAYQQARYKRFAHNGKVISNMNRILTVLLR